MTAQDPQYCGFKKGRGGLQFIEKTAQLTIKGLNPQRGENGSYQQGLH